MSKMDAESTPVSPFDNQAIRQSRGMGICIYVQNDRSNNSIEWAASALQNEEQWPAKCQAN